jgi:hypothetical protein
MDSVMVLAKWLARRRSTSKRHPMWALRAAGNFVWLSLEVLSNVIRGEAAHAQKRRMDF